MNIIRDVVLKRQNPFKMAKSTAKKILKKVLTREEVFGIINKPSQDGTTLKNEYSAKKEEMLEAEPD